MELATPHGVTYAIIVDHNLGMVLGPAYNRSGIAP